MIARLQRRWVLALLGCLCVWLVWQWPVSPTRALAGVAVLVLMTAWNLAWPFVLMRQVNRQAGGPQPTLAQLIRAWAVEAPAALAVFGWRQPFRSGAATDWLPVAATGQRGVVLVHGFLCNGAFWLPWLARLRAAGHAYAVPTLGPAFGSIDDYVQTLDESVQRVTVATGMPPVLLCHSMGGLAVRAWLQARQADDRVHRVITLGAPHGGAWLARFSHALNGGQMQLGSEWIRALHAAEPPGRAALFTCFYSDCDSIVFPTRTAALPGADNRFVPGLPHIRMAFDAQVVQACLGFLEDGHDRTNCCSAAKKLENIRENP